MCQRVVEGRGTLPGEGTTGGIGDGAGDHDGKPTPDLLEMRFDSKQGGLGVQRVEYGFDKDNIGAAIDQTAGGLLVGLNQFIEADIAEARIVYVRRERAGA